MYLRFNHVFFTTGNMKSKEYDNVVTSPNSYRKVVETETKVIPPHVTHVYMTAHIPGLARVHR